MAENDREASDHRHSTEDEQGRWVVNDRVHALHGCLLVGNDGKRGENAVEADSLLRNLVRGDTVPSELLKLVSRIWNLGSV